ncbi:MAG: Lrp/AsnC family transcriptional regulator [Candidatus Thorarchaeota archaeon]
MQSITESEKKLLDALLANSRNPVANLGEEIAKGRNWVSRTMKRLVRQGIIRAYVTVLDPAQVYAERNTILIIKTNPRELGVSKALLEMPELETLDGISGEHSLLGLFRFRGSGAFQDFLDRIDNAVAKSSSGEYQLVQVLTTYKTQGFVITKKGERQKVISPKDWELISALSRQQPDESSPFPSTQGEIGKRMEYPINQPAVSKAMLRLEKRGAIVGYTIEPDFKRIGLPIKFFLQIKTRPGKIGGTANHISSFSEVWDLHRTGTDYSLFATIRTKSVDAYNTFMRQLYMNEDILDTQSLVSLEEWFVPVR